ncbi:hypothetical protein AKJ16_DCAP27515 [Drosera capensis]
MLFLSLSQIQWHVFLQQGILKGRYSECYRTRIWFWLTGLQVGVMKVEKNGNLGSIRAPTIYSLKMANPSFLIRYCWSRGASAL